MKRILSIGGIGVFFVVTASSVQAAGVATSESYSSIHTMWMLIGAILVFFMQPGFIMLETGLTRAKNVSNIVIKAFMNFCLASVIFWIIGFGLMFNSDIGGIIGIPDIFVSRYLALSTGNEYPLPAYLLFQTLLCATTVAIMSGAMVERMKLSAYGIAAILISAIIYPISGHWVWGGGWLMQLGFHDFAGSAVVNMVGGLSALVGAKILGPRIGKYNTDGTTNAIRGHNMPLAALGVFILWFAWFGYNSAAVSVSSNSMLVTMSKNFMHTNMAAAFSVITVICITWIRYGKPDTSITLNGGLAGLVAITSGCDVVSTGGSAIIGCIAGIIVVYSIEFFDKIVKIDDPVGTISVHGMCGVAGTIMTGLFSVQDGLLYTGSITLFTNQIIGLVSLSIYILAITSVLFFFLKKTIGIRISADEETHGFNLQEHERIPAYADFVPVVTHTQSSDTSVPMKTAVQVQHKMVEEEGMMQGNPLIQVSIITSQTRFDVLKEALEKVGITGMTVTNVLGFGLQKGHMELYRGASVRSQLLPKVKVDLVISKIPVSVIVKTATEALYTGHYGDGKIFIYDVVDVVKIRTGEKSYDALQDKPIG
jgi:ammonium transporter, Amt family